MMMYRETIQRLCQEQTDLDRDDIAFIVSKADELMASTSHSSEDVFIDVKNLYSEHALVVFHKRPSEGISLYEHEVLGDTAYLEKEPGVLRTLQTGIPTMGLSAISQEGRLIQQTVFPIFRDNRVLACLILEREADKITPLHFSLKKNHHGGYELDDVFHESYVQQFSFLKYLDDGALVFNHEGKLVYANAAAEQLYRQQLGYMDAIDELDYDNLVLDHKSFTEVQLKSKDFRQAYATQVELVYGRYCFSIKQYVVPELGYLVMICRDITAVKQQQNQLQLAEVALREMNHRVKNHLQTVVSLLRLQAAQSAEADVRQSLEESTNRVLSIAMTHELLTVQNTDTILIAPLLTGVIKNVQQCFHHDRLAIAFSSQIDDSIELSSDRAMALALVVNELLQNSYDHAFEKKMIKNPKISLQIKKINDIIELQVKDNGNGYDYRNHSTSQLGLMIVDRFVKSKLSGKCVVSSSSQGTQTTVTFK